MASRQKPQNKEAEMSVLGCAFLSHSALCKVCEDVTEDMFAYQEHQVIFAAIRSLFEQKIPLDITTLKNELDKKKNLNGCWNEQARDYFEFFAFTGLMPSYYKGTALEMVTKKLEEYLDNASKEENAINII